MAKAFGGAAWHHHIGVWRMKIMYIFMTASMAVSRQYRRRSYRKAQLVAVAWRGVMATPGGNAGGGEMAKIYQ